MTYNQLYAEIARNLSRAADCVRHLHPPRQRDGGSLIGSMLEFDEFLANNEFELAWDVLAQLTDQADVSEDFWRVMLYVAELMETDRQIGIAQQHL
jgi:hypothetical protein